MARTKRAQPGRESRAAYAASQPLFDALRTACVRVGEQSQNLAIARDMVQQLHIKLPETGSHADYASYERSINGAVKAWRAATESYAEIFAALAKVTAAQPSEGKQARHGHTDFEAMARTSAAAKSAAHAFDLYEEPAKMEAANGLVQGGEAEDKASGGESDRDSDSDSDSASSGSSASKPDETGHVKSNAPSNPALSQFGKRPLPEESPQNNDSDQPPQKFQRLNGNIEKPTKDQAKPVEEDAGKLDVEHGSKMNGSKARYDKRREMQQRKRALKPVQQGARSKNAGSGANSTALGPDRRENASKPAHDLDFTSLGGDTKQEPEPRHVSEEKKVPGVDYEDVSAEVEARLKAKEKAKEDKKKEKKRKRESGDSFPAEYEESKPEKRSKKKRKAEEGESEVVASKEKQKKHDRAADEAVNVERSKKRKKAKI
ncbi:hypothetical protein LTR37_018574 [Vermiconidia calcicola]|uniref:Uncharacterized protein n=1 Tax=Vermiconidia calcicola TaxID=1690605 RepID=A0ACC3MGJ1_9PEZI|nr:hypothetical protein LTR37_018574 [Vermiconidia calcicola]